MKSTTVNHILLLVVCQLIGNLNCSRIGENRRWPDNLASALLAKRFDSLDIEPKDIIEELARSHILSNIFFPNNYMYDEYDRILPEEFETIVENIPTTYQQKERSSNNVKNADLDIRKRLVDCSKIAILTPGLMKLCSKS